MTHRYWDDFLVTGMPRLPNQARLNKALTFLPPNFHIESKDVNPVTVLLLVANESLSILTGYWEDRNHKWQQHEAAARKAAGVQPTTQIQYRVDPVLNSSASGVQGSQITYIFPGNWVVQPQSTYYFQQTTQGLETTLPSDAAFYDIKAHMSVYSFFNMYSSILDRLAHELAQLFSSTITAPRLDWGTLFKPAGQCILNNNDPGLALVLQNHRAHLNSAKTLRYRNVHTHQGYIPILVQPDFGVRQWKILLPKDPDDANSPRNVEALAFMKQELGKLIEFLNRVYAEILGKLSNSSPPW